MSNPKFNAIYLENKYDAIEGDSFDMTFIIYDSNNQIVEDLSPFKFAFRLKNGGLYLDKKDANYSGGGSAQISVSGRKVTVHIVEDDTETWEDDWWSAVLQMTNKLSNVRYTVFRKKVSITSELLDY